LTGSQAATIAEPKKPWSFDACLCVLQVREQEMRLAGQPDEQPETNGSNDRRSRSERLLCAMSLKSRAHVPIELESGFGECGSAFPGRIRAAFGVLQTGYLRTNGIIIPFSYAAKK
jgi:hypothetical protein